MVGFKSPASREKPRRGHRSAGLDGAAIRPCNPPRPIYEQIAKALLSTTILAGVSALPQGPAQAQTVWTGTNSTDWFTGTNWSAGVPAVGVEAIVNTVNARDPLVAGGVTGRAGRVVVGNNPTTAFINVSANGSLTIEQAATMSVAGAVLVNGALVVRDTGSLLQSSLSIGSSASGTAQILNGAVVQGGSGAVGVAGAGASVMTVDGLNSRWTITGDLDVGLLQQGQA